MGLVPKLPRRAWLVLGGDLLSAVGSGLTMPFFIVYLHRVRGLDLAVAGLALATIALASFAGNMIGGSLTDRIGARRSLIVGLCSRARVPPGSRSPPPHRQRSAPLPASGSATRSRGRRSTRCSR